MEISQHISEANKIIESAKIKPMTRESRCQNAIQLAACILHEAYEIQTKDELENQQQLSRMLNDSQGRVFTTLMTDRCFRSQSSSRVADQLDFIIDKYGVPQFLDWWKKMQLKTFRIFGKLFSGILVPLTKHTIRKETAKVILPGEPLALANHIARRKIDGVTVNLNHIGEAVLGEQEALRRLNIYLNDLANTNVEYISVKVSTICSQLNLISRQDTLKILSERLRQLFRAAKKSSYVNNNGETVSKFVNLDMEEYRDLHITVDLFKMVLDEPEFLDHSAGIVLQSYLPDSWPIQQELTDWSMQRVAQGTVPIKIRIVKGANLAMEKVEASLRGWSQAPYADKLDVDANFKRMVEYGCKPEHCNAVHLGIGSHNLFDLAYAMLLRAEYNVGKYVCFEMLEGMADPMRRVVNLLSGDMVLYCPAATDAEFQNAVAYLVRRLDENTAPQNFLRYAFNMVPDSPEWEIQAKLFTEACNAIDSVGYAPRRTQNRLQDPNRLSIFSPFLNEPDTDWSLPQNRQWAENIIDSWRNRKINPIPLVIAGKEIMGPELGKAEDPSNPGITYYEYSLAGKDELEQTLQTAENVKKAWGDVSVESKAQLLSDVAHQIRLHRADLIGAMIGDTGKIIAEADVEVSEAIDFAEYYLRDIQELQLLNDITWTPKGIVLVTPPWNFPCSIPAGGLLAALATGNVVVFKPAPEAVLVGWQLIQLFWQAGVSKDVLQFFNCDDETIGSQLIQDHRIDCVLLTGSTETARHFMKLRPGINLLAETGGKNALIVSALADRELAIRDIIQSAFGHAGQKCSACSLLILEAEVYDDLHFKKQLCDAAKSLKVGKAWDPSTRLNPLIHSPNPTLMRGLTTLDGDEEWALKPKQDPKNSNIWTPGIKYGVQPGSFSHQTELFGPVLSVMRAENLENAIFLANDTPYGLTSGLHSLDEREQDIWIENINAGNCYINRGITGAIVQRQPFGGCKESSFGIGMKAGGPNYLIQLMNFTQKDFPNELDDMPDFLQELKKVGDTFLVEPDTKKLWEVSLKSHAFHWNHYFSQDHDPTGLLGQDNILRYIPRELITFRIQGNEPLVDVLRVIAAGMICGTYLEISYDNQNPKNLALEQCIIKQEYPFPTIQENEETFIARINVGEIDRVRILGDTSDDLSTVLANQGCNVIRAPVMANGRVELICYLREMILSIDYHRYGYLGIRENNDKTTS